MKGQLLAVFLLMPILACSAQFDWLWARRGNHVTPQRQTNFGFMAPSTTPQPSFGGGNRRQRSWRNSGVPAGSLDAVAGVDMAGGTSYTQIESLPTMGNSGDSVNGAGTGDTSTNVDGSEWVPLGAGGDYGGNSGYGGNGGFGGNGGRSGGGNGVVGGASGGGGFGAGAMDPSMDDTMQNLNKASAGSIAGIVIGVIILLSVLAGVSFFIMRQLHRKVQVGAGVRA